MTFLPIVERELRQAARRASTYGMRFSAVLLAAFIALGLLSPSFRGVLNPTETGHTLFLAISALALGYGLIAGVRVTSDWRSTVSVTIFAPWPLNPSAIVPGARPGGLAGVQSIRPPKFNKACNRMNLKRTASCPNSQRVAEREWLRKTAPPRAGIRCGLGQTAVRESGPAVPRLTV